MKQQILRYLLGGLLIGAPCFTADAAIEALTEAEMESVSAGGIELDPKSGDFMIDVPGIASATGTLSTSVVDLVGQPSGGATLQITDQAQQHLRAMVNIAGVNSVIQVLLNLNINVQSTGLTIHQVNTGNQFGSPIAQASLPGL